MPCTPHKAGTMCSERVWGRASSRQMHLRSDRNSSECGEGQASGPKVTLSAGSHQSGTLMESVVSFPLPFATSLAVS